MNWTMDDFTDGPQGILVPGAVRGYRRWEVHPTFIEQRQFKWAGVDMSDIDVRVRAFNYTYVWKPGENTASCAIGRGHPEGEAAVPDCSCGFYALYKPSKPSLLRGYHLYGAIEGYGRTVLGRLGFRSEKARIVGLVGNARRYPFLKEFGVPVFRSRAILHWRFKPTDIEALKANIASQQSDDQ